MPELPEVETVVREIRPDLECRRFTAVQTSRKSLRGSRSGSRTKQVVGRTVRAVRRRGKWILIDLDDGLLVIHLGMTGQLTVTPADQPPADHTHFVADLDDGRQLRFRDIRRFGSVTLWNDAAAFVKAVDGRLGPEPFDLTASDLRSALASTRRCLKAVLLDQSVVAGIGNIYADESLFEAKMPPTQLGCDTTPAEIERLRRAIVTVLSRAIERRGSTIRNYVGGSGLSGSYQKEFRVYGQTDKPCPRCRTPIERRRLAGRSTHSCPNCQPAERPTAVRR